MRKFRKGKIEENYRERIRGNGEIWRRKNGGMGTNKRRRDIEGIILGVKGKMGK